jgi:hypothetical protein
MPRAFIPAPNTARVEMVYTCQGQIIENVFHVEGPHPLSLAELQAITNVFLAWYKTGAVGWYQQLVVSCALTTIKATALDTASSPLYINTPAAPIIGNISATPLPLGITFCMTAQTGHIGRSQRGRMYITGIANNLPQASPNVNLCSTGYVANCATLLNSLITQVAAIGAGYALVVTSYYNGGAWRAVANNTHITNWSFADYAFDSQRRRLANRGR